MKITISTLIVMIRLIGFNIQDIQIHVNIQFCNQRIKQGNTRKINNNNNTTVVPEGVIPKYL
jgi:hypothetical protein